MTAIAVMLAAGALCLWGAVASRSASSVAGSAVMLAAMVDHALTHAASPVVWGTVLVATGMLLGARLRPGSGAAVCGGANRGASMAAHGGTSVAASLAASAHPGPGARAGAGAGTAALPAIACAVSYPVMGLLLLVHGAMPVAGSGAPAQTAHAGHTGHGAGLLAVLPAVAAWALAAGLLALAVRAVVARRGAAAVETGGMSAMLIAMIV